MFWKKKKKKGDENPKLHVEFVPESEARTHPYTKDVLLDDDKPKIAAATILIPLAASAVVGLVTHWSKRAASQSHVLDLQQTVLLPGCYNNSSSNDSASACLLHNSYLVFTVVADDDSNNKKQQQQPLALGIWKIVASPDGSAIRLERKKWQWQQFLQPPEPRSFWTCQSLKFRDIAVTVEIESISSDSTKTALWEFVFSNVTEGELDKLMDESTDWRPAPPKPSPTVLSTPANTKTVTSTATNTSINNNKDTMEEEQPSNTSAIEEEKKDDDDNDNDDDPVLPLLCPPNLFGTEVQLSTDEVTDREPTPAATTSSSTKPTTTTTTLSKEDDDDDDDDEQNYRHVPVNIRVDVIETTRPNVLAPLLHESAKMAGDSIATLPLSKLLQSRISSTSKR